MRLTIPERKVGQYEEYRSSAEMCAEREDPSSAVINETFTEASFGCRYVCRVVASVGRLLDVPVVAGHNADEVGDMPEVRVELSDQERAFAAEVNRCRVALGLTQQRVAELAHVARSKISGACSGLYLPSGQVLDRLITALGMDRERAVALWKAAQAGRNQRKHTERRGRCPPLRLAGAPGTSR